MGQAKRHAGKHRAMASKLAPGIFGRKFYPVNICHFPFAETTGRHLPAVADDP